MYFDQKIPIWRAAGAVALGFEEQSPSQGVLDSLTTDGGLLAGYSLRMRLGREGVVLQADPSDEVEFSPIQTEATLEAIAAVEGIAWQAPLFVDSVYGLAMVAGDELLVKVEKDATVADVFGPTVGESRRVGGTTDLFVVERGVAGEAMLAEALRVAGLAGVVSAGPNFYVEAVTCTEDPLYEDQWHLNNTGQSDALEDADVDAPEAWGDTTPDVNIVIAVMDDGVQTDHPDLNMWVNDDEDPEDPESEPDKDDDGNGWVDDIHGYDFFHDDGDAGPRDAMDIHGTMVAGVAAAVGDNGIGVKGISYGSEVMSIKVLDTGVWMESVDSWVEAIYYPAGFTQDGEGTWPSADILNFSGMMPLDSDITDALDLAAAEGRGGRGLPIFASAGNAISGLGFAGYRKYDCTEFGIEEVPNADYSWVLSYERDTVGGVGKNTVWLGLFENTDGAMYRFDSLNPEAEGWDFEPPEVQGVLEWTDVWELEDDPEHAYGTGRYQLRPEKDEIGYGDKAAIMTPSFTVSDNTIEEAHVWLLKSCDPLDDVRFRLWSHDTESYWPDTDPIRESVGENRDILAPIAYPACLPSTIAVGATTDWDYRADYSRFEIPEAPVDAVGLDFVAPSSGGYGGIVTTDRTGTDGGDDGDYIAEFSGTSAASPLAAGIGALLLAKKDYLTPEQIRTIMRDASDQIGNVTYTDNYHELYGYGRVNAAAALTSDAMKYAGDLDCDGFVGQADLDIVLSDWGSDPPTDPRADPSGDDFVGQDDLDIVLSDWGDGELAESRDGGGGAAPESGGITFEVVEVDNSSVAALADYVTQDLVIDTASDWLSAQLIITLDSKGDIYQHAMGSSNPQSPNPAWFTLAR